jgi:hypothetical protein
VRRGLAGLLFFVAAVCLAVAASGWFLQRVAFDTQRSGELARVVLKDDAIRAQIAVTAAQATAATLGVPVEQVQGTVDSVANTTEGANLMRQLVSDAHARLIGARSEPVQITAAQLVDLTRDERVGAVGPVELPVEEVGALDTIRRALDWAVPIAAIVGGVALVLGLIAHPRKADAVFGIGMFCIIAGVLTAVLGYVVPVHVVSALTDNVWAPAIPAIAEYALPVVVAVSVVLVATGLALMIGAAAARRRKLWSSPVAIHRYGDQHRWS